MTATRHKASLIASLTLVALATLSPVPPAQAGPISDLMARHRQAKATRLPPMDKPFTLKKVRDPYPPKTASLSDRFKQRFSLKKGDGAIKDQGVIKTSR